MGNVFVVLRILPTSPDINLEELIKEVQRVLPENVIMKQHKQEEIAFGLNSILIGLIMPDEEGYIETIEQRIKNIEEVEDLTIENITRIL